MAKEYKLEDSHHTEWNWTYLWWKSSENLTPGGLQMLFPVFRNDLVVSTGLVQSCEKTLLKHTCGVEWIGGRRLLLIYLWLSSSRSRLCLCLYDIKS